jgi:predicted SAM-dependent methyltransferase
MQRFHRPIKQVLDYVSKKAEGKVLELGPGQIPFSKATHFCGHSEEEKSRLKNYSVCDFSSQVFPYKNKEFDFIYARHVIEDLYNPIHFLNECKRIAKAGFFETPSPYVEVTKEVEGEKCKHKGYHHHFSFVWTNGNQINLLHKYPLIEFIEFKLNKDLIQDPFVWNNYFMWENDFDIQHWQHEKNFITITDYPNLILKGINQSLNHTMNLKTNILKEMDECKNQ